MKMHIVLRYLIITIAAFFYGAAVTLFLDPNNIVPGGVTGIAMIISRFTDMETGTLIILINIPILLVGLKKFGFRFLCSTIYATVMISAFTNLLKNITPLTDSMFLAAYMGNLMIAVSLGVVFKCHVTTGGLDIIVKLLRLRYPHIKTGKLFFMADILVICIAGVVFSDMDAAFYAFIGILVMSIMFDLVLYGKDEAKLIYIISERSEKITERILTEMDCGVTFLKGRGAYSKQEREVILCVVKKNLSPKIEGIVKETDSDAFMIISSATEIYGEGYKDIFAEKV